jgi:hypothetical protein
VYILESLIGYLYRSQGVDIYNGRQTSIRLCMEVLVGVGPLKDEFEVSNLIAAVLFVTNLGPVADLESWHDYWMA